MKRKILIPFLILFLPFIGLVIVPYFSNTVMPWSKSNAIETAFSWGGLGNLPANATDVAVEKKGTAFSREFIVTFKCNNNDINGWILKSPGMANVISKDISSGKTRYHIPGKNGAIGGTVIIDRPNRTVVVDMSWS